jgi:hypothetical protein
VSPARRPSAPEPVEVRLPITDIVIGQRRERDGFVQRLPAVEL